MPNWPTAMQKARTPAETGLTLYDLRRSFGSVRTEAGLVWRVFPARTGIQLASRAGALSLAGYHQPRVRERIMKLSKVYSATCHHKYWSER